MRRFPRRTLWLWASLGVLVTGCLSPTVPLPPPSRPDIEAAGPGQFELMGVVPAETATVLVENVRTHRIYGQANVQEYDIVVGANPGDTMHLWYEVGMEESDDVEFDIPTDLPGAAGAASPPDAGTSDSGNP